MFEVLEKILMKDYSDQFAMQIILCSPLSAIHKNSMKDVQEEKEKYNITYFLSSDDFYYIDRYMTDINTEKILNDRDKILYTYITNEDKEDFIVQVSNYLLKL